MSSRKSQGKNRRVLYEDSGAMPDTVPRKCTDGIWVCGAVVFFISFFFGLTASTVCGDMFRHTGFRAGDGSRCMLDSGKPYLFFCNNGTDMADSHPEGATISNLNLDIVNGGVCVSECPMHEHMRMEECGGARDYFTVGIMGMFCTPVEVSPFSAYWPVLRGYVQVAKVRVLLQIVVQRYEALLAMWFIAVFASYIEIYILEYHAGCLVRFGLVTLSFGCLLSGGYLMSWYSVAHFEPLYSPYNVPGAVVLLCLGVFFSFVLWNAQDSVETATACMELACTCVMQTTSLALSPMLSSLVHLVLMSAASYGGLMFISCWRHHSHGLTVVYDLSSNERMAMLLLFISYAGIQLIVFAVAEFVVAYGGVLWYFSRKAHLESEDGNKDKLLARLRKRTILCRSLWHALRYHFGTLVLGGWVIGTSRIVRMPLRIMVGWMKMNNPISRLFRHLFCHFVDLYGAVRPLRKSAFIDVALNGSSFFVAARNTAYVSTQQSEAVRILHGATWLFQIVGISSNACLGACFMLYYSSAVMHDDPNVTLTMCTLGAFLTAVFSVPFAMIFDSVADTILHCYVVEELRREEETVQLEGASGSQRGDRGCACLSGGGPSAREFIDDMLNNVYGVRPARKKAKMQLDSETEREDTQALLNSAENTLGDIEEMTPLAVRNALF